MSREDWICVLLIIIGIVLFLVGANIYNEVVGWTGFFMFVGALVVLIGMYIYHWLTSRGLETVEPAELAPQVV